MGLRHGGKRTTIRRVHTVSGWTPQRGTARIGRTRGRAAPRTGTRAHTRDNAVTGLRGYHGIARLRPRLVLAGRLARIRVLPVLTLMRLCGSAFAVAVLGIAIAPLAAAAPVNYDALPVDPNVITDSTAYIAEAPQSNPAGQPGVEQVFTHRDGSRAITDTVWVLADPQAAAGALQAARSRLGTILTEQSSEAAPVGENGTLVSGPSPDGSQWVGVLQFTRGNTAVQAAFDSARNDPVPTDLVVEYGQRQDQVIRQLLGQ